MEVHPKEDLLRPDAYPDPRPTSVELVETHISWVFLLDHEVFKIKKPVDLGFLDFRSIEQRKEACEAEARLNARLAPDVYRGVVPVRRGADGRACIAGAGPIVDWAVHMARLPDRIRADQLLAQGALDPGTLEKIAARIARFHREAKVHSRDSPLAAPDTVAANVEENFAQTRESIGRYLRPEEHAEIVRWQRSVLRDRRALLENRAASGRIREGHGDLRLEHVYVAENGSIAILDCIEFNERFRVADVCADIAFLSMDLAARGRVDWAERLIACYAREAGDFDLYALLDFYEGYRAYVRGKIAAMMADDPAIDLAAQEVAAADARRYFLLALSADRRSLLSPALVAIGGVIASGKSTVAERVAAAMSAPIVDTDRTRKELWGVEPDDRIREAAFTGAYGPEVTERVYREALRRAEVVLASGRPVVLDASFRSRKMRDEARALAHSMNVPFRFVECRTDPAIARVRLAAREQKRGVSDARLDLFDSFVESFEPVTEMSPAEHLVLDTGVPIEQAFSRLRDLLATWPAGFSG